MNVINVAVDGPAGAGKSTIAKAVAKNLGFIYVDTGALYRTIGVYATEKRVDFEDLPTLEDLLQKTKIEIKYENDVQKVYCNGVDFSDKIRTPEASMAASNVSKIPMVREFLLSLQRDIAKQNSCIMDGRDIGTVVLPDAKIKIFLTADVKERAKRRFIELREKGSSVTFEEVLDDMEKRDYQDSHREIAPLKIAKDSILVDTTSLDLEQSIEKMIKTVKDNM